MYELYSGQRPGNPARSLIATAVLLILAVGVAKALILYRARAVSVQLGPRNEYSEAQLAFRLPVGWGPVPSGVWPPGAVVGVENPGTEKRRMRLFVFRGIATSDSAPSEGGLRTILVAASALGVDTPPGREPSGSIGGFPGVTAVLVSRQRLSEGDYPFFLGSATVAPAGEAFGVLLQSEAPPGKTEQAVLDLVAASLELLSVSLDADPDKLMAAAGISFEPPSGVRFAGPVDPGVPRLRMMGGEREEAWYLELNRVPLVGKRTPAALVEDRALSAQEESRLSTPVEVFQTADREVARVSVAVYPDQPPALYVMAVRADPHTALLMVGRYESRADKTLRDLCQSLAGTAKVVSFDELVDVESALNSGRRMIQEVTSEGMSAVFRERAGKKYRFRVAAPMFRLGTSIESWRLMRDNGQTWWDITDTWTFRPAWLERDAIVRVEEYRLADDGIRYRYSLRRDDGGRTTIRKSEVRIDDLKVVRQEVGTPRGTRTDVIEVDDTFACNPVLMEAAARLSRAPKAESVIMSGIDTFTTGTACFVMTPIGRTTLPHSDLKDSGWTVRLTADYHPSPVLLYFDDQGSLVGTSHDGLQWRERLSEPPESEEEADGPTRSRR